MRSLRALVVVIPLFAVAASSCSTTYESNGLPQNEPGAVSGVASPCGLPGPKQRVVVRLSQNSKVVAIETVTGSHHFIFSEPVGWYVLSSDQSKVKPVRVQLISSLDVIVNLPSDCY